MIIKTQSGVVSEKETKVTCVSKCNLLHNVLWYNKWKLVNDQK